MTIDPHNMVGAYALDALDDEERKWFQVHLADCAACRDEVLGFLETAARLGDEAETSLPPSLKDSIMAAIATSPQGRPEVSSLNARRGLRRALPRVFIAAAAASVVILGSALVIEHGQNDDDDAQQVAIETVISAPDAEMSTERLDGGATARMFTSAELDKAVVVVKGLPDLESDRVYQLWTIVGDSPRSAGLLEADGEPSSKLVSDVSDVDAVAITEEPEGGSEKPTTAPIATMTV